MSDSQRVSSDPTPDPRQPTQQELDQLVVEITQHLGDIDQEERRNAQKLVESAYIAVFDRYASFEQGRFAGKLMTVVWPSGPEWSEVYIWPNGKMSKVTDQP